MVPIPALLCALAKVDTHDGPIRADRMNPEKGFRVVSVFRKNLQVQPFLGNVHAHFPEDMERPLDLMHLSLDRVNVDVVIDGKLPMPARRANSYAKWCAAGKYQPTQGWRKFAPDPQGKIKTLCSDLPKDLKLFPPRGHGRSIHSMFCFVIDVDLI
jgi:hypothetical protein